MFKREFKVNLKSLIIWLLTIVIIYIISFIIYPILIENKESIISFINTLPTEIINIFNSSKINISSVSNWLVTLKYLFINLLACLYFSFMGSSILTLEDNTITFLLSKPISRNKIMTSKLLVGITYIIIFNLVIFLTTLIGLKLTNNFVLEFWLIDLIQCLLINLFFLILSMLISNYIKNVKKSTSLNITIIFITYFISIISLINEKVEFLKYFSLFEYINNKLNILYLVIIIFSIIIELIILYKGYNKREL